MKCTFFLLTGAYLLAMASAADLATVNISVYYESLCPDSRAFITHQLTPIYTRLGKYLNVDLVPFGNVKVTLGKNGSAPTYACQHGPAECYGNRAQACAFTTIRSQQRTPSEQELLSLSYVDCMFLGARPGVTGAENEWKNSTATSEDCARLLALNWTTIKACANGPEGEKLFEANGKKTDALKPKHTSVPWIVVNGVHDQTAQKAMQENAGKYLCDKYLNSAPECEDNSGNDN